MSSTTAALKRSLRHSSDVEGYDDKQAFVAPKCPAKATKKIAGKVVAIAQWLMVGAHELILGKIRCDEH